MTPTCKHGRYLSCEECGARASKLCDFPLGGKKAGKTCDAPICSKCAVSVGKLTDGDTRDFCPTHARITTQEIDNTKG